MSAAATQPKEHRHTATARVTALLALAGLLAGSLALVIAAARGPSVLAPPLKHDMNGWITGPFHGIWPGKFRRGQSLELPLALLLLWMLACYGAALASARHIGPRLAWGTLVALHVVFLLGPPLLLTDAFNYSAYARMGVVHHLNPYVHLPVAIRHDFVYRLSNWHHLRDPYGPLFTLGTYALVPLGVVKSFWAYKLAVTAASLGCIGLVGRCARLLERPAVPAMLLVGLNPIVLAYGLGGQHNDVFMMLFLLGAFACALEQRYATAGGLVVIAAAVKAPAAALVPVFILGSRRSGRAALGAAAAAGVTAAVSLAVFGAHLPNFSGQTDLQTAWSIPATLGIALGLGGETPTLRLVLELVLAAGIVACAVWAWRSKRILEPAACALMLEVGTVGWAVPWYILWLLPFFAFLPQSRRITRPALVLVAWLTLQFLPIVPALLQRGLDVQPWQTGVGKQAKARFERLLR